MGLGRGTYKTSFFPAISLGQSMIALWTLCFVMLRWSRCYLELDTRVHAHTPTYTRKCLRLHFLTLSLSLPLSLSHTHTISPFLSSLFNFLTLFLNLISMHVYVDQCIFSFSFPLLFFIVLSLSLSLSLSLCKLSNFI